MPLRRLRLLSQTPSGSVLPVGGNSSSNSSSSGGWSRDFFLVFTSNTLRSLRRYEIGIYSRAVLVPRSAIQKKNTRTMLQQHPHSLSGGHVHRDPPGRQLHLDHPPQTQHSNSMDVDNTSSHEIETPPMRVKGRDHPCDGSCEHEGTHTGVTNTLEDPTATPGETYKKNPSQNQKEKTPASMERRPRDPSQRDRGSRSQAPT